MSSSSNLSSNSSDYTCSDTESVKPCKSKKVKCKDICDEPIVKWIVVRSKDGRRGRDGKEGRRGRDGKEGKEGKEGQPGKDGKEGKEGQPGKDGTGGILGYTYGVNNATTFAIPSGNVVPFNQSDYQSLGITISGSVITLLQPGTFAIDYLVRGTLTDPTAFLEFGLVANDTIPVSGSWIKANKDTVATCSLLLTVPDISKGILTGAGTTLSLINKSTSVITLTSSGQNSASIRILKIA